MSGKRSSPRRTVEASGTKTLARPSVRRRETQPTEASSTVVAELAQTFYDLLLRHRASMKAALDEQGLSPPLMATLHMLGDAAMTMRELAEHVGLEPSNLTGIVDRLEARGLVERQSSPDDRRIKKVSLTRAGSSMRQRLVARLQQPSPWMLQLSARDQQRLLLILRKAMSSTAAPAAGPPSSKSRR